MVPRYMWLNFPSNRRYSWLLPGEGIQRHQGEFVCFTDPGVITLQVGARELPAPEEVLIDPLP